LLGNLQSFSVAVEFGEVAISGNTAFEESAKFDALKKVDRKKVVKRIATNCFFFESAFISFLLHEMIMPGFKSFWSSMTSVKVINGKLFQRQDFLARRSTSSTILEPSFKPRESFELLLVKIDYFSDEILRYKIIDGTTDSRRSRTTGSYGTRTSLSDKQLPSAGIVPEQCCQILRSCKY